MKIKSRKIFAILLIAVMMLTLLPFTVFAAANRFASSVEPDKDSEVASTVGDPKKITFTVSVFDGNYAPEACVKSSELEVIGEVLKNSLPEKIKNSLTSLRTSQPLPLQKIFSF
ncbi:MAG: hypothetical protein AB1796_04355 [Bacillota bacterium]